MDGKKISFGFSKIVKKPQLNSVPKKEEEKIELIECLEGQEIKVSGKTSPTVSAPLVIPLKNGTSPLERLIEKKKPQEKEEGSTEVSSEINKEETLDQRAAREIIESLRKAEEASEEKVFAVPLKADDLPLDGASESTLDDYDSVPIQQFGLAMLRGMGWKEEEHKKKENIDETIVCRPKGLGLGADKVVKSTKPQNSSSVSKEELKIKKDAHVKILGGKFAEMYGQVEGMDEETGRINVKLALGGRESISEYLIEPVTEKEFLQNRKVINVAKYEEYKKRQDNPEKSRSSHQNSSRKERESHRRRSSSEEDRRRSSKSKSRRHRRDSSGSESDGRIHRHSSSRRDRDYRDSRKSSHSKSRHRDRH
ncbi:G-patch domain and KOW motifs-containing protein [Phlebotomus papatasi]|uniref:G-patch domain and KOW motifs-containing protein n=1 Tax=Phlebotomus papatasi TaxID=29031 RepID=UPI002483349D|nr:G-patch domain and KOW motifs-containing protein [Phlebotomus papatasi]